LQISIKEIKIFTGNNKKIIFKAMITILARKEIDLPNHEISVQGSFLSELEHLNACKEFS